MLDNKLVVSNVYSFSIKKSQVNDSEPVLIQCASQIEKFVINNTMFVSMKGLHFSSCGENMVSTVQELILEDAIFQGVKRGRRGTALVLDHVTTARINESLFYSNEPRGKSQYQVLLSNYVTLKYYVDLLLRNYVLVSGALFATFSNIDIVNSRFVYNTAEVGGALLAYHSSISISNCKHVQNRASKGGVIVVSESSVSILNSSFYKNAAELGEADGGVIIAFSSTFIIDGATFKQNHAAGNGGVMYMRGGNVTVSNSTFIMNDSGNNETEDCTDYNGGIFYAYYGGERMYIFNSIFIRNIAFGCGGVIRGSSSIITINNSIFVDNAAIIGGVVFTSQGSLSIIGSTFSNNFAIIDGGVAKVAGGLLNISQCMFANNTSYRDGGVIDTEQGSFVIRSSTFIINSARHAGGVISSIQATSNITNSTFTSNKVYTWGGVIETSKGVSNITNCTFSNNNAFYNGGVMHTEREVIYSTRNVFSGNTVNSTGGVIRSLSSSVDIVSTTFTMNIANECGGVIDSSGGTFTIIGSTFTSNKAIFHGGVIYTSSTTFNMSNNYFVNNTVYRYHGGVISSSSGSFFIASSNFTKNTANDSGGVVKAMGCRSLVITCSNFTNNKASSGGVMYIKYETGSIYIGYHPIAEYRVTIMNKTYVLRNNPNEDSFPSGNTFVISEGNTSIMNSSFTDNHAKHGGIVYTIHGSFKIISSTFTSNTASDMGGVVNAEHGRFTITSSTFAHNTAYRGGVFLAYYGSFIITDSIINNNKAHGHGGVIICSKGSFNIAHSSFTYNAAFELGKIIFVTGCSTNIANSIFKYNSGSLYVFDGNLTFTGQSKFVDFVEPSNKTIYGHTDQEGGAITSFKSSVILRGENTFLNNRAGQGGAILATESKIIFYGITVIANNTATSSNGGGISIQQSELEVKGSCFIVQNGAQRGGGVHTRSSTLAVYQRGLLQFISNIADKGGGIYLELNSKLYILKLYSNSYSESENIMIFSDNHANYGGAMYADDSSNSGACLPNIECFIQTLALHLESPSTDKLKNIIYSGNSAAERGSNLFGGLLDRCIASTYSEVHLGDRSLLYYAITNKRPTFCGFTYLKFLSNISKNSIASLPVGVCFCEHKRRPNCSYQPPPIQVKKGETFTISLVAVDQVEHSVHANIISSLDSHNGGFSEGQQVQSVGRNCCTNLTFNVFSPNDYEYINLFAEGPCGSSTVSMKRLTIQFLNCTCLVGFEPSNSEVTRCKCVCDSKLSPYITNCDAKTSSIIKVNTNSWITYINDTNSRGYVIHPNCPFDYCLPQTANVSINLNVPNGADTQCAFNRTGILCGACQEHLSLSLGSSRCLPCPSHWPAVFVVILLAAIIAGMLLVTALLALNMTVATGLINNFIFYANTVVINRSIFFPSTKPSFSAILAAWLNLEAGLDVCFIDGLDMYAKTWLQLAFPMYIISLVIAVIVVSKYSLKFARLIGRKDPVATLATLILMSYANLLSVTITALSFGELDYPDGSRELVWLPDGTVKFFQGKHIPLAIVAVLIILVGLPYTLILFLWQWLVRAHQWRIFKWTTNTKLNTFVSTYHAPYENKYRFWTGLLLIVRIVLYVTASATTSSNPQLSVLLTIIIMGSLLILKGSIGLRLYKKVLIDILEIMLYFNIFSLASITLYDFKMNTSKQTAIAYTSTIITFLLLFAVIAYHVISLISCRKRATSGLDNLNEHLLAPTVTQAERKVTHTVIDRPKSVVKNSPKQAKNDIIVMPKAIEVAVTTFT